MISQKGSAISEATIKTDALTDSAEIPLTRAAITPKSYNQFQLK